MIGPLVFQPLYQSRVWGGRALEAAFDRDLPPAVKVGESWEVVDRPREQSVVARGPHAGRTLRQLIEAHGSALMGAGWEAARRFPILVKWLDCRERLSLQVHPPAAVAPAVGGEPKTENWYIAAAEPGASLIAGLTRGVTRDAFARALATGALEPLVHRVPVRAGDSMFVPSGRIHAIGGGTLILEIQQNSDTTYRVYDWGRLGDDGRPRALHVAESLQSIDFEDFEPDALRPAGDDAVLAACPEFRVRRHHRAAGGSLPAPSGEVSLLSVASGALIVENAGGCESFRAGDNVLLPADTPSVLRAATGSTVIVTEGFSAA